MSDIPLHPLVVHAVVVLVPLAFVGIVAALLSRQWRGPVPVSIAAMAVAGAVFAFIAVQSGSALEDEVEDRAEAQGQELEVDDHENAGKTARMLSIVFAVAAVSAAVAHYTWPRASERRYELAMLGVTALVGIAATGSVVLAGDTGGKLVWNGPGNFVTGEGSESSDDDDDRRGHDDDD